jgi:hypothetical protein
MPACLGGVTRGACVTHLRRGASRTGEGDPGRGPLVRSPGQGQQHPQDWRCRCRRATIASPARPQGSPAGTACAPLACSTEIVMRGRHGTRPTCLCQHHFHLPPWPSTMIPSGWTPCGPCTKQGAANRDVMACTSAAVPTSGRRRGGQQRTVQTPVDCSRRLKQIRASWARARDEQPSFFAHERQRTREGLSERVIAPRRASHGRAARL